MASPGTHSACVSLRLLVEDRQLLLTHVGPERVRLREATELPTQRATVLVSVDGCERLYPVLLPDGIRPGVRDVRIVPVASE